MKILKRILIILICLILVGYLAYKIAYPYVAPILFDYIVDTNLDAFVKLEQSLSESLDSAPETEAEPSDPVTTASPEGEELPTDETPAPDTQPDDKKPVASATPAGTPKPDTSIQAVKTTMGVFSGEHLARALKNMSPADKTRIISLCQSAVSTADILKVSTMMLQDGLTKEQQKYIENYLRDNLSVEYKREILEILKQY